MKSSFFEFNVAVSGLTVARGAMNTVSHNIANASRKGYSRQYVEQRATMPLNFYNSRGMIGTGAEIYGINQHRDFYLDKKFWSETGVLGEYSSKASSLSLIERTMNEMSTTGLSSNFDDFFDRLQDLTTNSGDPTYRTNVIELGDTMAIQFKNTYQSMKSQQKDINTEIKVTVDIINSYGTQIASLNKQIAKSELDGSIANDLRDSRALLVDKLSEYVNINVKELEKNPEYAAGKYPNPDDRGKSIKEYRIQINGYDFVTGDEVELLSCVERKAIDDEGNTINAKQNIEDNTGLYDIVFKRTGAKFDMYSSNLKGTLKGLIDVRDGNNGNYFSETPEDVSYDRSTGKLKFTVPAGRDPRLDLSHSGGKIKIKDTEGNENEYMYSKYKYSVDDSTGEITIEIDMTKPEGYSTYPDLDVDTINGGKITIGDTTSYKGIPYYLARLNSMVRTFATALNEGTYMNGEDIPGVIGHINGFNGGDPPKNLQTLFFTYKDNDGNTAYFDYIGTENGKTNYNVLDITAENFIINQDLRKSPELLAAAESATSGIDDNNVILSFLKIKSDRSLFMEGTLKDYLIGMTGELGIDLNSAESFTKNYTDVTAVIDNQRMSVSSVDINEEIMNLMRYQQQYMAAAKLINIIDRIYDTTINQIGV